ncbi:argininosuccinate lyase [Actinocatenispora thailandica]|uniref:argininosuccinate lyase n=1 Tax=Actinocatenispora thailandica TaxID=227318 RepID=A0A7R7HWD8_9ACTN|nr:argininosuccinate lyase [Actinocatenispora thailandica]
MPDEAAAALAEQLLQITSQPASEFPYDPLYGDAYNSRERELERRLGAGAGWLHTSRTRREAGRIAFRLAVRDRLLDLHEAVSGFAEVLSGRASEQAETVWADNTYLQPAQPSTFGHYLGGFGEECVRHLTRLENAFALIDRSPAGAGGVGGTRLALDRDILAERLGFAVPAAHTRDAMWAIDEFIEVAFAALCAVITADRLAEDLEIFTSPGFGYVGLDASLCRASVLMPQKRNPYALAVIRASANTMVGMLTGLVATARTPSARTDNWLNTYGQVAQILDTANRVVELASEVVRTLQIDEEALTLAAGTKFTGAADLAEELVLRNGVDYRSAYRIVGRAVACAIDEDRATMSELDVENAAELILRRRLGIDATILRDALDPSHIVATRTVVGGSAPGQVKDHACALLERVRNASGWRDDRREHIASVEEEIVDAAVGLTRIRAGHGGNAQQ